MKFAYIQKVLKPWFTQQNIKAVFKMYGVISQKEIFLYIYLLWYDLEIYSRLPSLI